MQSDLAGIYSKCGIGAITGEICQLDIGLIRFLTDSLDVEIEEDLSCALDVAVDGECAETRTVLHSLEQGGQRLALRVEPIVARKLNPVAGKEQQVGSQLVDTREDALLESSDMVGLKIREDDDANRLGEA